MSKDEFEWKVEFSHRLRSQNGECNLHTQTEENYYVISHGSDVYGVHAHCFYDFVNQKYCDEHFEITIVTKLNNLYEHINDAERNMIEDLIYHDLVD